MKETFKLILITILSLILVSCVKEVSESEARERLHKHLEARYGEPFEIEYLGRRSTHKDQWYEAQIYPARYIGQPESNDKYFKRTGIVEIGKGKLGGEKIIHVGDTYGMVALNESANKFYMPKLQELFEDQVLPVIQIRAPVIHKSADFIETMKYIKDNDRWLFLQGGIYIWGRIDSLEDKERFREKIFAFITYMKETETFEQVDLAFYILDERSLVPRFDAEIGDKLIEAREELKTADEFIEYRKELLKELDEEFKEMAMEEKETKINSFNRTNLLDTWGWDYSENKLNKYSVIYHKVIRSRKYLEVESRLHEFKKLDFMDLDELKLLNTIKVDYKEYDKQKFYNQEWDGE